MALLTDTARQLIKESVDVESLLKALGFKISRCTSGEVRAPCIIHGGDNTTAFSIRTDTKKWCCFTKHCEQNYSGTSDNDIIALVRKVNGCGFTDAVRFLCELSGLDFDSAQMRAGETTEYRRQKDTARFIKAQRRITERAQPLPTISEELVQGYIMSRDDYFLREGFLSSTLEFFEIGAKYDHEGILRATIPIRDSQGALVSISARRVDGDEEPRYRLEKEFQKGRILYNAHNAIATGKTTVIIVEGFKALWSVYEAGYFNTVACMGSIVTDEQVLALCSAGFLNCILMLDGDDSGRKGTPKSEKRLKQAFNVTVIYLPEGESPDSFLRQELSDLLEMYTETVR